MRQQMNVEQAFRIKKLLAERRLSITSLAMKLGEAYGSVANTIYGHRRNPELRGKIAAFLGRTPEDLFGGNGEDSQVENLGHQSQPFVDGGHTAIARSDPGAFLPSMLQGIQGKEHLPRHFRSGRIDGTNATRFVSLIIIKHIHSTPTFQVSVAPSMRD